MFSVLVRITGGLAPLAALFNLLLCLLRSKAACKPVRWLRINGDLAHSGARIDFCLLGFLSVLFHDVFGVYVRMFSFVAMTKEKRALVAFGPKHRPDVSVVSHMLREGGNA